MKRNLSVLIALVMLLTLAFAASAEDLTMGSWRADDVDNMTQLLAVYEKESGDHIEFQPTNPQDYNATLRLQLESGTGPDLMYARSYATGADLYNTGYFAKINDVAGLKDAFTDQDLDPWTVNGDNFAIPLQAVTHAVYYNKDIFKANNIEIPTTFEDFLAACEKLKAAGVTPLANGVKDEWDILECFFLGMLPNYIGGPEGRVAYENGTAKLNDEKMVAAYTDIGKVASYLPDGFEAVSYNDSQSLFATGKAAMFMDGSWTIKAYDGVDFEWGTFAMPAPKGNTQATTWHLDAAIGANAASPKLEAAKKFLAWLCTQNGADALSQYLPAGMYPITHMKVTLSDAHSQEMLDLANSISVKDVRFVWPKLMDLYTPMNQAVIAVLEGKQTPQAAADSVETAFEALPKK